MNPTTSPKTFTLTLSEQTVNIIALALHEAPLSKRVADMVLGELKQQIDAQSAAEQPADNVVPIKQADEELAS